MKHRVIMLAVAALIASGSAFAQQSQPAAQTQPNQPAPTVNQRRDNQQDRIANGIDSGQLTAGETKNLESREANLNREIKDDRTADGGKLTSARAAASQSPAEQSEPLDLPGQAQRQHGTLRQ